MQYKIIRSKRKSISLCIDAGGLTVRAPYSMSDKDIEKFVQSRKGWIDKHKAVIERQKDIVPLSDEELKLLKKRAKEYIPQRVKLFADLLGVKYGSVTIRAQKSRWGSCSSKHNLNFNCLLMLTPIEVIDAIVVHELCHLKQMNHSKAFYAEIYKVYPEYDKWNKWLKENGNKIIARIK